MELVTKSERLRLSVVIGIITRDKTRRLYKLFFFFLKTTISCTHMVNSQNTEVSAGLLLSSRSLQWYVHFNISDEPLHDQSCRDNRLKVGLIHGNL